MSWFSCILFVRRSSQVAPRCQAASLFIGSQVCRRSLRANCVKARLVLLAASGDGCSHSYSPSRIGCGAFDRVGWKQNKGVGRTQHWRYFVPWQCFAHGLAGGLLEGSSHASSRCKLSLPGCTQLTSSTSNCLPMTCRRSAMAGSPTPALRPCRAPITPAHVASSVAMSLARRRTLPMRRRLCSRRWRRPLPHCRSIPLRCCRPI
jgi:hypothetical protein